MEKTKKQLTEQKKIQALVDGLTSIQKHPGWKTIVRALAKQIKTAEQVLHGELVMGEGETIEFWQKIRQDRIKAMDLPNLIIKDLESGRIFPVEFDPYD